MGSIRQQQPPQPQPQQHQGQPDVRPVRQQQPEPVVSDSMGWAHAASAVSEHISDKEEEQQNSAVENQRAPAQMGQRIQRQPPTASSSSSSRAVWGPAQQQASMGQQQQQQTGSAMISGGEPLALAKQTKKRPTSGAPKSQVRKNQQQQSGYDYPCYDTPESDVQFRANNFTAAPPQTNQRCSSQAANCTTTQSPVVASYVQQPQRSRSALAGSLASSNNATLMARQSMTMSRAKTTRVRINSTSEQIQDPNWLIRMGQELEAQQQQQKKGHLKALHRKLKSTLANTITGGGGGGGSCSLDSSLMASSSGNGGGGGGQSSGGQQQPATPTKMPVSILKQRHQSTTLLAPAAKNPARRSPVPQAQSTASASAKNRSPRDRTNKPASQLIQAEVSSGVSPTRLGAATTTATTTAATGVATATGQQQQAATEQQSASSIKPICADGQVKVSGWKRNNLLAKTLSHFDEIRGNQRPVFVPTKIRLPPAQVQSAAKARQTKFAEIVREAVSKKNLLAPTSSSSMGKSQDASAICNLLLQQHHQNQRASVSASDQASGEPIEQTSTAAAAAAAAAAADLAHRCMSADGSSSQTGQQQVRSSSAAGSPNSSGRLFHHHQHPSTPTVQTSPIGKNQSQSRAQSRQGSQTPLASQQQQLQNQLINQLLLNSSAQQALNYQDASPSSSRSFKLQLKNNQVLQNLRRQSNELQAQLQQADPDNGNHQLSSSSSATAAVGALAAASSPSSTHLKDWKRLAGKLSQLTSSGSSSSRHGAQLANRNLLSVLSNGPEQTSGNLQPLRLTVSNQEQSSSSPGSGAANLNQHPRRGNSQLQLPATSGGFDGDGDVDLDPTDSKQARKLSSSSMVVQPVSSRQQQQQQLETTATTITTLGAQGDHLRAPRRRSDSEAYRSLSNAFDDLQQEREREQQPKPAIVVNRNDLLQLLQVTSGSSTINSGNNSTGHSSSSGEALLQPGGDRCIIGLRTQSDSGVPAAATTCSSSTCGSLAAGGQLSSALFATRVAAATAASSLGKSALETLVADGKAPAVSIIADADNDDENNHRGDISKQRDSCTTEASSLLDDEGSQTPLFANSSDDATRGIAAAAAVAVAAGPLMTAGSQQQQPEGQQPAEKARADLSWVVKQTSKVAFFQQKLRKMRWHSKQRDKQQHQQSGNENSATEDRRGGSAKKSKHAGDSELNQQEHQHEHQQHQQQQQQQQQQRGTTSGEFGSGDNSAVASDVFMDPELIGDAIEIFLRSTMQSNSSTGKHNDEGAATEENISGHSGSSRGSGHSEQDEQQSAAGNSGSPILSTRPMKDGRGMGERTSESSELACGSQD